MSVVAAVLASVLGIACIAVLAALFLPLRLEVRATAAGALRWTVALRPFGRFGPRIALRRRRPGGAAQKTAADRGPARRPRRRADRRHLAGAGIGLMRDILGAVRIEDLFLDLRFGTDDPGETGQIYGMLTPVIFGLAGRRRFRIQIEPVFDRAVLAGRAGLDASITPAWVLPAVVRFGWAVFGPSR